MLWLDIRYKSIIHGAREVFQFILRGFMYICNNCMAVFSRPDTIQEKHGLDSPPYETVPVCPTCHDPDIAEAMECEDCGCWVPSFFETKSGHVYCKDCCHFRAGW